MSDLVGNPKDSFVVTRLICSCVPYIIEDLPPEEISIFLYMGHDNLHPALWRLMEVFLPTQLADDYGIRSHYRGVALFVARLVTGRSIVVHVQIVLLLLFLLLAVSCQQKITDYT